MTATCSAITAPVPFPVIPQDGTAIVTVTDCDIPGGIEGGAELGILVTVILNEGQQPSYSRSYDGKAGETKSS